MFKFKLTAIILSVLAATGCATQQKYDAWSKVETAKQSSKSSQADALAKIATTAKDPTLAAFAVFSLSQLKDTGNPSPMPTDDLLEYVKILAPLGAGLWSKNLDVILQTRVNNNALIQNLHTTDALVKTPKVVSPQVVNPVVIETPSPVE